MHSLPVEDEHWHVPGLKARPTDEHHEKMLWMSGSGRTLTNLHSDAIFSLSSNEATDEGLACYESIGSSEDPS